jgi:hypothetical protein
VVDLCEHGYASSGFGVRGTGKILDQVRELCTLEMMLESF